MNYRETVAAATKEDSGFDEAERRRRNINLFVVIDQVSSCWVIHRKELPLNLAWHRVPEGNGLAPLGNSKFLDNLLLLLRSSQSEENLLSRLSEAVSRVEKHYSDIKWVTCSLGGGKYTLVHCLSQNCQQHRNKLNFRQFSPASIPLQLRLDIGDRVALVVVRRRWRCSGIRWNEGNAVPRVFLDLRRRWMDGWSFRELIDPVIQRDNRESHALVKWILFMGIMKDLLVVYFFGVTRWWTENYEGSCVWVGVKESLGGWSPGWD